jgi:hypothetical protein
MIGTALIAKALPWALLAAVVAIPSAYLVGKSHGESDEADRQAAAGASAFVEAVKDAAAVGAQIVRIGERLAIALQASTTAETEEVRTVREVIRENPDFGAMRRPAALERVRRTQLEAVRAATEAGRL